MSNQIQMVDLKGQYEKIKASIDSAILETVSSTQFINGPQVKTFAENLAYYTEAKHVIPCANGTDALQIALMALDLKAGDEIICPSFTYVATAEVIGLLGLTPVMADVNPNTFNISAELIEPLINSNTKVIVPVHLYGQSCEMEGILNLAKKHNLYVIEDNAQAIGAKYTFKDGSVQSAGTMGDIGTTSFFPSKNLGCYGDGGAIFTNNDELAVRLRMIANHGQEVKYYHKVIGCNSRLDSIQASILDIKLKYLNKYSAARNQMATKYDEAFSSIEGLQTPKRQENSTHVFHQYTLKTKPEFRDKIISYLKEKGVPAMIYYPVPLYKQEAFSHYVDSGFEIPNVEMLCQSVFSLPIHTEIESSSQDYIIQE
ncbi:MAG: DegT/DnrJ/EryC1/StrS family aminotransferase, partial [Bacteroidetes bacterium]|nr:DegT/DnrJ/EryC1/StrS family aminotransferase [Bacteroidota bacterium]